MRELVESIKKFYLGEGQGKASSPIEYGDYSRSTKLTKYNSGSQFQSPNRYSPDYSGVTHTVNWKNIQNKSQLTPKEQIRTLADAKHLHHDFIDKITQVGDVVANSPIGDADGGNKRSRIYKKQGFGELDTHKNQHGIVKQYPNDHPDESMRGKKYLHPLEPSDIDAHGTKPSKGGDKDEVRHIHTSRHKHTRMNDNIHTFKHEFPLSDNSYLSSHDNNSNISDVDKTFQAGKEHYLKPGDSITRDLPRKRQDSSFGKSTPTGNLRNVSVGHMLGFPAPKNYQQTGVIQKDSKYLKAKD